MRKVPYCKLLESNFHKQDERCNMRMYEIVCLIEIGLSQRKLFFYLESLTSSKKGFEYYFNMTAKVSIRKTSCM